MPTASVPAIFALFVKIINLNNLNNLKGVPPPTHTHTPKKNSPTGGM